jgi:hypothetical protein
VPIGRPWAWVEATRKAPTVRWGNRIRIVDLMSGSDTLRCADSSASASFLFLLVHNHFTSDGVATLEGAARLRAQVTIWRGLLREMVPCGAEDTLSAANRLLELLTASPERRVNPTEIRWAFGVLKGRARALASRKEERSGK